MKPICIILKYYIDYILPLTNMLMYEKVYLVCISKNMYLLAFLSSQGRGRGVALIECKLVNY